MGYAGRVVHASDGIAVGSLVPELCMCSGTSVAPWLLSGSVTGMTQRSLADAFDAADSAAGDAVLCRPSALRRDDRSTTRKGNRATISVCTAIQAVCVGHRHPNQTNTTTLMLLTNHGTHSAKERWFTDHETCEQCMQKVWQSAASE